MAEYMDSRGTPDKRSLSESENPLPKSQKCESEGSDIDTDVRLFAIVEKFYNEEWVEGWDDGPVDPSMKNLLIKFGVAAHKYIEPRFQGTMRSLTDVSSLRKMVHEGFQAMTTRLDKLENAQKTELQKGNVQLSAIDEHCKKLVKQTVPSEAEKTYLQITKKVLPRKEKDSTEPRVEQAIETKNRFLVLETEEDWKVKTDDHLKKAKNEIRNVFKGQNVRTQRILKTTAGNISIEFDDQMNQEKAENVLRANTPIHMQLRRKREQLTHLAMRGVPSELNEDELRAELQDKNADDFPIFNEPTKYTIRTGTERTNRRTRTWKLSVPREEAVRMVRQKRLFLEIESVFVELWAPGHKRCTSCFSTNHKANFPTRCQNMRCNICAGSHKNSDCTKIDRKEHHKCYVCVMNRMASNHCATTKECPILGKEALLEAKKATADLYGH